MELRYIAVLTTPGFTLGSSSKGDPSLRPVNIPGMPETWGGGTRYFDV